MHSFAGSEAARDNVVLSKGDSKAITPGFAPRIFAVSTSKTPPSSATPHSQRRQSGGARIELSERVTLRVNGASDPATEGWTLNVSRGGLRAVIERELDPALEYEVEVGDGPARRASIAWSKGEADGQIVGLRFLDVEGSVPPEDGTMPGTSGP